MVDPAPPVAPVIIDGRTGDPLGWGEALKSRLTDADVVILGEQHDDEAGHRLQLRLARMLFEQPNAALSLEMLERDEQQLVDDYLDGVITAEVFERETFSQNWGGRDTWRDYYQPIIDAAKERGLPVIAANAPRRYVRLARTDGYDRLRSLDHARQALFDLPDGAAMSEPTNPYRQRFFDLMGGGPRPESPDGSGMNEEQITALFNAQVVWDETMAASIAEAFHRGRSPIVHLVGQFHSDHEGGMVQALRRRAPDARLVTVSVIRTAQRVHGLRADDVGRADVVIYMAQ